MAGRLKLIDFGIASSVQSDMTSVMKDTQMGTFNFMSPEAIQDLSGGGEFFLSVMASKPIIIRWIRNGSHPYRKIIVSYYIYIQLSTNIKIIQS